MRRNYSKKVTQVIITVMTLVLLFSVTYPVNAADTSIWQLIGNVGSASASYDGISQYYDNGTLYVAYSQEVNGDHEVTVEKYSDGSWTTVGPEGFTNPSSWDASRPSIFVDNGIPYVAYIDVTNFSGTQVTVMKYTNGNWQTVGEPRIPLGEDSFANSVSLYVDDGTPYIVVSTETYNPYRSNKVSVLKYSGASWQFVGEQCFSALNLTSWTPSIYVYNHVPYVAYAEYDNDLVEFLRVQRFTSGAWHDVGNLSNISFDDPMNAEIKIDNGDIYVAYCDAGYKKVLKYSDAEWAVLGNINLDDLGYANSNVSLTIVGGVPYVAFKSDLYHFSVKKLNGTNWELVSNGYFSTSSNFMEASLVSDQNALYLAWINSSSQGTVYRYGIPVEVLIDAQPPVIALQPKDAIVNINEPANLLVTATGSGSLSYEWFSNSISSTTGGTSLGISSNSFAAPTNGVGTTYYYCIVTNTDSSATGNKTASTVSNIAEVTVNALTNAQAPTITTQPSDVTVSVGEAANLSVAATGTGTLSYEWFKNTTNSATGGISLGITENSYTAPTDVPGTTYYYCVVTNTDNSATGSKTASTVSKIGMVTVLDETTNSPIDQLLSSVDEAIEDGTLQGNGSSNKLDAFRDKLADVKEKIEAGEIKAAINKLNSIFSQVDGMPAPKDLVVGESAHEIAQMILDLIKELESQLLINR